MKPKSVSFSLCLSVFTLIFLAIVGCGGGGDGGGNTAPPQPTSADLSLSKSVDMPTPDIGDDVVFTITVANAGPIDATGVIVTDKLPSGFTYVTDTSGGAYDPATGEWSVGSLAVGDSRALDITAAVNLTGNYLNIAEVTASDQPDPDSRPANGVPNEDDFASATAAPPSIKVSINQIQTECLANPGSTDVLAFATVIDQLGNPVTTLTKNDFILRENGTAFDTFDVEFANPITLSVSIVMDYSTSILNSGIITEVEDAVITFIGLLSAADRAEIIKFNQLPIEVAIDFTSDKAALTAAVIEPFDFAAKSELYEAALRGVNDLSLEPSANRKAVIVITDGRNNSDVNTPVGRVITAANDNSIPVFAIAIGADINLSDLTRLTAETGGLLYQSTDKQTVEEIYQQLTDALVINQFVFTYNSSLTGGAPATLEIEAEINGLTDSDSRQFTTCP